jgi:hypothetical protein
LFGNFDFPSDLILPRQIRGAGIDQRRHELGPRLGVQRSDERNEVGGVPLNRRADTGLVGRLFGRLSIGDAAFPVKCGRVRILSGVVKSGQFADAIKRTVLWSERFHCIALHPGVFRCTCNECNAMQ